jgi:hypothetical protein
MKADRDAALVELGRLQVELQALEAEFAATCTCDHS